MNAVRVRALIRALPRNSLLSRILEAFCAIGEATYAELVIARGGN